MSLELSGLYAAKQCSWDGLEEAVGFMGRLVIPLTFPNFLSNLVFYETVGNCAAQVSW